jgi:hypothetical protein
MVPLMLLLLLNRLADGLADAIPVNISTTSTLLPAATLPAAPLPGHGRSASGTSVGIRDRTTCAVSCVLI